MPADRVTSANPWHIVLVLDDSGSMSGPPAQSLNAAVEGMIAELQLVSQGRKPYFRLSVIGFGSSPMIFAEAESEQTIDLDRVTRFSGDSGGTDIAAALDKARELLRRNGGEANHFTPYVFLMSDGHPDDQASALKAADALKTLEIPAGSPRLVSIGVTGADEGFMRAVASNSELFVFCDADRLKRLFPQIGTNVGTLAGGGTAGMDQVIVEAADDTTEI